MYHYTLILSFVIALSFSPLLLSSSRYLPTFHLVRCLTNLFHYPSTSYFPSIYATTLCTVALVYHITFIDHHTTIVIYHTTILFLLYLLIYLSLSTTILSIPSILPSIYAVSQYPFPIIPYYSHTTNTPYSTNLSI